MSVMETVVELIKETVLPELAALKASTVRVEDRLAGMEKRLDDVNLHLVDQSRRIDQVNGRIDQVREEVLQRIDQVIGRIDQVREELVQRIDQVNGRIDQVRVDLLQRIDKVNGRIDQIIEHVGRLYQVIVRREEHFDLVEKVGRLESEVAEIKRKLAA